MNTTLSSMSATNSTTVSSICNSRVITIKISTSSTGVTCTTGVSSSIRVDTTNSYSIRVSTATSSTMHSRISVSTNCTKINNTIRSDSDNNTKSSGYSVIATVFKRKNAKCAK